MSANSCRTKRRAPRHVPSWGSFRLQVFLSLAVLSALGPVSVRGQNLTGRPPQPKIAVPLDSTLAAEEQRFAAAVQPLAVLQQEAANRGIRMNNEGRVHVEIVGPEGQPAATPEWITPLGAQVTNQYRNRTEAWIPIGRLTAAAQAIPKGHFIYRVPPLGYDAVAGEGPAAVNSDSYEGGGADGSGLTIAVIDGGFDNLTQARANGDAPAAAISTDINYSGNTFEEPSDGTHGIGCLEAAFDHCPGATWRIYKIDSLTDVGTAVTNGLANGVDVFTHSLSWYNTGWGDNSGAACSAANSASGSGALFFTSAGNRAEQHRQENFDGNGDDWHDFSPGDETIDITVANGDGGDYYLQWNTSGGTYDYDLYLYADDLSTVLASSTNGGNTFETFYYENNTGAARTVHLAVYRDSGGTTEFELFLHGSGDWLEHIMPVGSTTSPSNATGANVISNAAVHFSNFGQPGGTIGIIKDYSSRGPSNSGMTIPDLSGPTDTTGFTYSGGFGGTSSATPNNAGAACAFWSADTLLSAAGVRWLLFEQADIWQDWGSAGKDNIYGEGGTLLTDYVPGTIWVARGNNNTADLRERPFYTAQAAYNAVPNGGRLLFFPGGNYPETALMAGTKRVDLETLVNSAVLGNP